MGTACGAFGFLLKAIGFIHLYLYIYRLRPVDIMVMKKLHHKVNIIPLIAKSDMLTKPEVKRLKEQVKYDIVTKCISIVTKRRASMIKLSKFSSNYKIYFEA